MEQPSLRDLQNLVNAAAEAEDPPFGSPIQLEKYQQPSGLFCFDLEELDALLHQVAMYHY